MWNITLNSNFSNKTSEQPGTLSPLSSPGSTPAGSSANGDENFDPDSERRGNDGAPIDRSVWVETMTSWLAEAELFRDRSPPMSTAATSQFIDGSKKVTKTSSCRRKA
jgi:hypothetical protein